MISHSSVRQTWLLLGLALLLPLLALGFQLFPGAASDVVRPLLVLASLVTAGLAVNARLHPFPETGADRLPAASFVGIAALAPFLGVQALDPSWDSAALVLHLLAVVALSGAALVALPGSWRRGIVSLLVIFHLGGILTAINFAAPGSGEVPWIASRLWSGVYRPYLQLLHLSSSYRFFAPEPDASVELWARVEYTGGATRWLWLPCRQEYLTGLEYHRQQKLIDSVNRFYTQPQAALVGLDALAQRRAEAGMKYNPPIPVGDTEPSFQYREPIPRARRLLGALARHAALTCRDPADPSRAVTGVKLYRVVHRLLTPQEFREGLEPFDLTTYLAYFQGEYNAEGELKPECFHLSFDGTTQTVKIHQDPFLYWLIPITRETPDGAHPRDRMLRDGPIQNFVSLHAGDLKGGKAK